MKFPETIYCKHYEHSNEERPSLSAESREPDCVDEDGAVTEVATYKLVCVRKLQKKVEEVK